MPAHGGHSVSGVQALAQGGDVLAIGEGFVALQVDHGVVCRIGPEAQPGGVAAVRAGWVLAGQDGVSACAAHGVRYVGMVRGHEHVIDVGVCLSGAPSMDDHGCAPDVGKRLSRQPGGVHPGGNDGGDLHGVNV